MDSFALRHFTIEGIISYAYADVSADGTEAGVTAPNQIVGLPSWAQHTSFDVVGKAAPEEQTKLASLSLEERQRAYRAMLRSALGERFHLSVRIGKVERPAYALAVAKGGITFRPSVVPEMQSILSTGRGHLAMRGKTMSALTESLTEAVGRPIVNRTGLVETYDLKLDWDPEIAEAPSDARPPLATALREQLGLQLSPAKAFVTEIQVLDVKDPGDN